MSDPSPEADGTEDSEITLACPECDHAKILKRTGRYIDYAPDERWVCEECRAEFREPVRRESRAIVTGVERRFGLARRLADADSDEVSR